ncbi:unnamed protein product [Paramecium sonneborni]|uniref:Uncharacterized protein n=1 Tax=Paramecium sonneborni TaxID=65129 RepID=A0A8S1RAB4_9CILI|nr:unnamed protein product [Paramecium sonneborni]
MQKILRLGILLKQMCQFQDCFIYNRDHCLSFQCVFNDRISFEIRDLINYILTKLNVIIRVKKIHIVNGNNKNQLKLLGYLKMRRFTNIFIRQQIMQLRSSCINQMEQCTDYMQESQYYSTLNIKICFWQKVEGICLEKLCDDFVFKIDQIIIKRIYDIMRYSSYLNCNIIIQQIEFIVQLELLEMMLKVKQDAQQINQEININITKVNVTIKHVKLLRKQPILILGVKIMIKYWIKLYLKIEVVSIDLLFVLNMLEKKIVTLQKIKVVFGLIKNVNQNNVILHHHHLQTMIVNNLEIVWQIQEVIVFQNHYNVKLSIQRLAVIQIHIRREIKFGQILNYIVLFNQIQVYFTIHLTCQILNPNCIFNIQQFGFIDLSCDHISNIKDCMPECTINVFSQSFNLQVLAGCIKKFEQCQLYSKEQCFKTIKGYFCRWDISKLSPHLTRYFFINNIIFELYQFKFIS